MPTLLRRFLLWAFVCVASAAPSFVIAVQTREYDVAAMVAAVFLFILIYTALTSTAAFERFHRRPFVRRTLYIGYGTRVMISIVFPIAMFPDIFAGAISVGFVDNVLRVPPRSFAGTFLATCVSGTLLNILVFTFMGVVYAIQRAFMNPPPGHEPRGFAVVLNAPPGTPGTPPAAAIAVDPTNP